MSLRGRMGIAAGAAVAVAVLAVALSSYAGTRSELRDQIDQSLRNICRPYLHGVGAPDGGGPPPGSAPRAPSGVEQLFGPGGHAIRPPIGSGQGPDIGGGAPPFGGAPGTLTIIHPNGTTFQPQGQSYVIPATSRTKAVARTGQGRFFTDQTVKGTHIRVLVTGIGSDGALVAALPLTDVDHTLSRELLLIILIAAGGIALAALLGMLVARTALAPIARFTSQTESIAARPDRLEHERLDVDGRDELARLGASFNTTLDALENSVAAQRNLVADASHELRTPIATIRANLQLMRDEQLLSPEDREALRADMIDELDELTQLVGDVVELARGSKPSAAPDDVRVDLIVTAALDRARRRAPELQFSSRLEPTLVTGEAPRIARAITNLLDNAAKWSPSGGLVEVELRDGTVTVRDHGPGFQAEDLPFVFDRFHRARDARSKPGSGLGLAIVRQAAEAHGGFAEAVNAPDGGALTRVGFGPTLALEPDAAVEPLSAG